MSDIFGGTGLMPAPSPHGTQQPGGFGLMLRRLMQQQGQQGAAHMGGIPGMFGGGGQMPNSGFGGPNEGMYQNFLAPGSFQGRAGAMPWAF